MIIVGLTILERVKGLVAIGSLDIWTMTGFRDRDDAIHNGFGGRGSRNTHEGYFDITRRVRIDVPTYDDKIDATTFSDWIVAMEDYFD